MNNLLQNSATLLSITYCIRGTQLLGARSPWRHHFVGPQYGTCFISSIYRLEFWGGFKSFVKFVHTCSMSLGRSQSWPGISGELNRNVSRSLCIAVFTVCIAVFTLDVGLLARSQYSQDPATGHLNTGFSWFPCAQKQMLRWFPRFQVATTYFSCSPPELNLLVTNFIFSINVK